MVSVVLALFIGAVLSESIIGDEQVLQANPSSSSNPGNPGKPEHTDNPIDPGNAEVTSFIGEYQEPILKDFFTFIRSKTRWVRDGELQLKPNEGYFNKQDIEGFGPVTDNYNEVEPGGTVYYYLPELPQNHKIKLELSEHSHKREVISVLEEKWFDEAGRIEVNVPNEYGKLLVFKMELYDEKQQKKDILMIPYYTSFKSVNASLAINKSEYKQDETLSLYLENWGPNHISHGEGYGLQRQEGNQWVPPSEEEFKAIFNAIALQTSPYETYVQHINLEKLRPGTYRIIKPFSTVTSEGMISLSRTFTILP